MRNRFAGRCQLCGCYLAPKQGRWRLMAGLRASQNFQGLRCIPCGTTTKKGRKLTAQRLALLTKQNKDLSIKENKNNENNL